MEATRQRIAIDGKMRKVLFQLWREAGIYRRSGWGRSCDNYERGKAIVRKAANRNSALYFAGIKLLADYLEI